MLQILEQIDEIIESSSLPSHDSAYSGNAALAMYQYYSAKVLEDENKLEYGEELLDSIIARLPKENTTVMDYSLATGLSGLCMTLSILPADNCIDFDVEERLSCFDELLISATKNGLADRRVDFLYQSLGVVHYFTTRKLTKSTKSVLENFADDIINASVQDEQGARFLDSSGPKYGNLYDLSISNGLSGILLILLRIHDLGIRKEKIRSFIIEGVEYILKFYISKPNPEKSQSMFALGVDKDEEEAQYSTIMSWCYGDLNQLILLIQASQSLNISEWNHIIRNVSKKLCARTIEEGLVRCSNFNMGASGVCHIFQYLFDMTGNKDFLKAKYMWLEATLNQVTIDFKKNKYKNKEIELLDGLLGVGLVLLSEISDKKLSWSKLVLM